jgi:septal ring factor EnvC (AmiA/AmiB activator)
MSRSLLAKLLLPLMLAFLVFNTVSVADDKSVREKQLKTLLQKIDKIKQAIDVKEDNKSSYTKQLKSVERKIGKVNQQIRATDKKITAKKSELKALRATRLKHQRKLSQENDYLAEQVYAAFTLGRQERAKLLFSQENPQALQRNLVYYQYFSNARVALINDVQRNIDKIIATEELIQQAQLDLEQNQKSLGAQIKELKVDLGKRKTIVSSLDKELKQQGGSLSRLQDEATQLKNLIKSIEEIFVDAPESEISQKAFAELKGKLAWPVKGKVKKLFGRNKPQSELRWQGIVIEAPNGRQVKAVSHGRIAFSDWLRGLGNLVIIDHGNSYLSLYGHNESLYKSAGEWDEAGDVIGTIGNSGGQNKSGLYFEIRKKGRPQNPTGWCKSKNKFASG